MIAGASLHGAARGRFHPPASGTVVGNPPAELGSPLQQHSPPSMRPPSGMTSHRAVQREWRSASIRHHAQGLLRPGHPAVMGNISWPLAMQSGCQTIPGRFVQAAAGTPR